MYRKKNKKTRELKKNQLKPKKFGKKRTKKTKKQN